MLVSTLAQAQRDDLNKMAVLLAKDQTSMTVGRVRYDLVGTDHPHTSDPSSLFLRVARNKEGGWKVNVYDHTKKLVMTGNYVDEDLTIADGTFTFYYPNGNMESSGQFVLGNKVGVWERFSERGDTLHERYYDDRRATYEVVKKCGWTISCRP